MIRLAGTLSKLASCYLAASRDMSDMCVCQAIMPLYVGLDACAYA